MSPQEPESQTPPPPGTLADLEVIRRVLGGEPALYELVMRRYNRFLFRLARSVMRDDDEARDVVQESYLRAYRKLEQFRGPGGFKSWLAQIVLNEARVRLRKPLILVDDDEDALTEVHGLKSDEPEFDAMSCEAQRIIETAIDGLPDDFRVVFMLRGVEQLSIAESAALLGIKEATVKTRFHRARSLLKHALTRRLDDLAPNTFDFDGTRCDAIVATVLARLPLQGTVDSSAGSQPCRDEPELPPLRLH
jgi:RNA polymerase sigma-70 factor (ECF subfamily)